MHLKAITLWKLVLLIIHWFYAAIFIRNVVPKSAYWHFNSVLILHKGFWEPLINFGLFLEKGKLILSVLSSGGTMEKQQSNFSVGSMRSMSSPQV